MGDEAAYGHRICRHNNHDSNADELFNRDVMVALRGAPLRGVCLPKSDEKLRKPGSSTLP